MDNDDSSFEELSLGQNIARWHELARIERRRPVDLSNKEDLMAHLSSYHGHGIKSPNLSSSYVELPSPVGYVLDNTSYRHGLTRGFSRGTPEYNMVMEPSRELNLTEMQFLHEKLHEGVHRGMAHYTEDGIHQHLQ